MLAPVQGLAAAPAAAPAPALRVARRRLYILPTRAGVLILLGLATMLLGSINYSSSLGYMLTFWVAATVLVSMFHTHRNLLGLTLLPGRARPTFVGELAVFDLTLVEPGNVARHGVMLRYQPATADAEHDRDTTESLVRTSVPRAGRVRLGLAARATRRGRLRLSRVTLATRYPFGLFRAWSVLDIDLSVLVYPRPLGSAPLPLPGGTGTAEARRGVTGNDEYSGLRNYQVGDSLRHVHWKLAARSVDLPVKTFDGSPGGDLSLDFDQAPGGVEARLSQLTRWVLEADRLGLRYALRVPGAEQPVAAGEPHTQRCLTLLALHGRGGD